MGDRIHKNDALRYGLPRLSQTSTRVGLITAALGTAAVLFGVPPGIADVIGGLGGQVIGAAVAAYGAHAVLKDDGSA